MEEVVVMRVDGRPVLTVAQTFEELGKPEYVGCAFAVCEHGFGTKALFKKDGSLDMAKLPKPDYEHRVYQDNLTGNCLVVRPDENGVFDEAALMCRPGAAKPGRVQMQRLR